MSEIKLREPDEDLIPLLRQCSSDELANLVSYLTRKGGVSSQLKNTRVYRRHHPEHEKYADEIAAEIQKYGGNTILNIVRGGFGVTYREIVMKVADRLKVKYAAADDIARIEQRLLLKVLEASWGKMNDSEKTALLEGIIPETGAENLPRDFPIGLLQTALIAGGGLASYKLSLLVAGAVSSMTIKRGIGMVASTALTRWSAALAGAVGLGVATVWTLFDVLGPAYRVLIPCVLHIAMLRQLHLLKERGVDPRQPEKP